jgi:uncharacterized Zn finger protein
MDDLALECPHCGEVTEHELLHSTAGSWTVSCLQCRTPRGVPAPKAPRPIIVPVILAEGAMSRKTQVEVDRSETVAVGDELELEGHRVMVTGLEMQDGRLPKRTTAGTLRVLHAKMFDTVTLHLQLNQYDVTRSFNWVVDPDRIISVGEPVELEGVPLIIATVTSAEHKTMRRGGLPARRILKAKVKSALPKPRTQTPRRPAPRPGRKPFNPRSKGAPPRKRR